jgi:predicted phage tail protein
MFLVVLAILGVSVLGGAVQMVALKEEADRKRARQMLPPPPPP